MEVLQRVEEARKFLASKLADWRPRIGLTLGTGLSGLAARLEQRLKIPYQEIPGFGLSTVESHEGALILGDLAGKAVAALAGRFHLYEGYQATEVVIPVRVLGLLGVDTFIFCNAAGGLDPDMIPGRVMLIRDHINLSGANPLTGPNIDQWGERFVDMSAVYDPSLRALARQAAQEIGAQIYEGVYVSVPGPSLETPAETAMLRRLGADAVGMSTVLEVIAARHMGMRVAAFSAISNVNRPEAMEAIAIDEVIANAEEAGQTLSRLLAGMLAEL